MTLRPLALVPILLVAACAGSDATFPSLEPRPVEKLLTTPPVVTPVMPSDDAALDTRVAAILATAETHAHGFDAALVAARADAARAGAGVVGSEPWFTAQQALTALGAARSPVATALADLDRERIEAAARAVPVDSTRLDAAHDRIAAIMATQDRAYEALATTLPNQ